MADMNKLHDDAVAGVAGGGANGPVWTEGGATYYRVVRGDTLSEIALKYGTTVYNIQALNRELIKNIDVIREGWVIRIR